MGCAARDQIRDCGSPTSSLGQAVVQPRERGGRQVGRRRVLRARHPATVRSVAPNAPAPSEARLFRRAKQRRQSSRYSSTRQVSEGVPNRPHPTIAASWRPAPGPQWVRAPSASYRHSACLIVAKPRADSAASDSLLARAVAGPPVQVPQEGVGGLLDRHVRVPNAGIDDRYSRIQRRLDPAQERRRLPDIAGRHAEVWLVVNHADGVAIRRRRRAVHGAGPGARPAAVTTSAPRS
jgi:hypothetical protein